MRDMAILMLGEIIGAALTIYVIGRIIQRRIKEAMSIAANAEREECAKIGDNHVRALQNVWMHCRDKPEIEPKAALAVKMAENITRLIRERE